MNHREISFLFFLKTSSSNNNKENEKLKRSNNLKPNKQLPEKAIRLMNAWYLSHEDNPYPNRNDLDYLATNGGIKESQVKAWFSNKRNRTQNTHPKRAKRYLVRNQLATNSSSWNEPEKLHVAEQLEQRILPQLTTANYPNTTSFPTHWNWTTTHSSEYSFPYYSHYESYPV